MVSESNVKFIANKLYDLLVETSAIPESMIPEVLYNELGQDNFAEFGRLLEEAV